jgi:hypothetical protein
MQTVNPQTTSLADFDAAVEHTLDRIRAELKRALVLKANGRFDQAASDPANTDDYNFAIAIEETLEVTQEMQRKPRDPADLETEILQSAATFAGWLVARTRRAAA